MTVLDMMQLAEARVLAPLLRPAGQAALRGRLHVSAVMAAVARYGSASRDMITDDVLQAVADGVLSGDDLMGSRGVVVLRLARGGHLSLISRHGLLMDWSSMSDGILNMVAGDVLSMPQAQALSKTALLHGDAVVSLAEHMLSANPAAAEVFVSLGPDTQRDLLRSVEVRRAVADRLVPPEALRCIPAALFTPSLLASLRDGIITGTQLLSLP
eukprot:CAMPEP_0198420854 /NCGR_PEP_ID=MMETSP1452-20131203/1208_1 /TAXON_ID=1181717 /ORGANISM="Synchroma pusillum, Strain CCMP3072" /LENGTH=212 /DNA_ID=CAMNT_0044141031 /DNA_START=20 /DNA_END=654 /DNA_ORIENTATION=-